MKRIQLVMYSALLLLFCSAFSQAQQRTATAKNTDSGTDTSAITGKGAKDYVPLWLTSTSLGDSKIFQTSTGEVGIGTTAPAATLDVNGTVNASSSFNLGGSAFAFGNASIGNAFLGFSGNSTLTGAQNTATGSGALESDTTGALNTANGVAALAYNLTGSNNMASGYAALQYNTTGSNNTASGFEALNGNTTGYDNTASGTEALVDNTTGSENTVYGFAAMEYGTGSYSTAIGLDALHGNNLPDNTGSYNTALGWISGYTLDGSAITGSNNTAVGGYSAFSTGTLTNATVIGYGAEVGQSNALALGGPLGSGYNVNVGIGTATPSNVFTIAQGAGAAISDGWTTYSSRRWKTNIQTLHGALDKVEQLRGVSYDLKANGKHEVGVIAEEVGAVVPEVVTWDKNGKDAQSVDYSRLTALLIEATKEQQSLINQQQAQIRAQQAQIARLASQVKTIQVSLETSGQTGSEVRTVKAKVRTVQQ